MPKWSPYNYPVRRGRGPRHAMAPHSTSGRHTVIRGGHGVKQSHGTLRSTDEGHLTFPRVSVLPACSACRAAVVQHRRLSLREAPGRHVGTRGWEGPRAFRRPGDHRARARVEAANADDGPSSLVRRQTCVGLVNPSLQAAIHFLVVGKVLRGRVRSRFGVGRSKRPGCGWSREKAGTIRWRARRPDRGRPRAARHEHTTPT